MAELHGKTFTKEYRAWSAMKSRCDNPLDAAYANYGGRGLSYEKSWRNFSSFYADLGISGEELSLERRDNNKGYSKENCYWATRLEQNNNKRLDRRNKTGISGVRKMTGKWIAECSYLQRRTTLYYGPDFFEACCARKASEVAV